ncbi:hypothetical protein CASFOL_040599 [Castilleja foliolosa]|uniref:RNase H type-1 domain-containing protein n=1 Tax=Castilleja foliolosa TaxID=1961234 RepID=A0ABD3BC33_9LAMI
MVVLVSRKCKDHWLALAQTNQGEGLKAKIWTPPPENWIKVNVDAAYSNGSSFSALVFKDSNGSITFAAAHKHSCLDPITAETLAILEACKELEKQNICLAIIESDCLNAITFINVSSQNGSWSAAPLIDKIRRYKHRWKDWKFKFVSRLANNAPHALAKWALFCNHVGVIPLHLIPTSVFCNIGYPLLAGL